MNDCTKLGITKADVVISVIELATQVVLRQGSIKFISKICVFVKPDFYSVVVI